MGCHNRRMPYSTPRGVGSGSVRPNRTMTYCDHLMTPLWDHQYRYSCRLREYQYQLHDPRGGPPLASAAGGREPPRLGRRRTPPVGGSVRPDPAACRSPFPPEFGPWLSLPGIVTHRSRCLTPGPPPAAMT